MPGRVAKKTCKMFLISLNPGQISAASLKFPLCILQYHDKIGVYAMLLIEAIRLCSRSKPTPFLTSAKQSIAQLYKHPRIPRSKHKTNAARPRHS
ncbi:hypothetical protein AX14_001942 [Amanita brunnescens Koide BX004]|nr:hypothetical protein AX14_001942 [Amanita brunnescens Koide BX004]